MPHHAAAISAPLPDRREPLPNRVLSVRTWATLAGISYSQAKHLIAIGKGPRIITRMSANRVGVTVTSHHAWLNERTEA